MTIADPEQRPDAVVALSDWKVIRESIYTAKKEWRPRQRNEDLVGKVALDVVSLYQLFMHFARSYILRTEN